MQKLDLNLAANPFRNNVLLWLGYGSATAGLLLFSLWSVNRYFEYDARLADLRNRVGNFENRRLDLETRGRHALKAIRDFDIDALELQASMANTVIDRKAFSWTRLFNSIEQIQPYQVRMTSVKPVFNAERGGGASVSGTGSGVPVALEGIAKSWIEFTNLERALQDDPHFGRILPMRLTKTDNNEVLFQVRFDYYPEGNASVEDETIEIPEEGLLAAVDAGEPDGVSGDDSDGKTPSGEGAEPPAAEAPTVAPGEGPSDSDERAEEAS